MERPLPSDSRRPKLLALRGEESALYREAISDDCWREVWNNLGNELSQIDTNPVQQLSRRIAAGIMAIDSAMTEYCELTCPTCQDPCCTGHKVFFNRTDLLYLVALGEGIPPGQTRTQPGMPCRYLAPDGCRLSRILRPYVCVWFICEAQMELFQKQSAAFQRQFIRTMQEIRAFRLELESIYEHHFPGSVQTP